MTEPPVEYSLSELSKETGVEARTIRSYISMGLLPSPKRLGANTRYPESTLLRLRAIAKMRKSKASISEIKLQLAENDDDEIARLAGTFGEAAAAEALPSDTALEYLEALAAAPTLLRAALPIRWSDSGLSKQPSLHDIDPAARQPVHNRPTPALPRAEVLAASMSIREDRADADILLKTLSQQLSDFHAAIERQLHKERQELMRVSEELMRVSSEQRQSRTFQEHQREFSGTLQHQLMHLTELLEKQALLPPAPLQTDNVLDHRSSVATLRLASGALDDSNSTWESLPVTEDLVLRVRRDGLSTKRLLPKMIDALRAIWRENGHEK